MDQAVQADQTKDQPDSALADPSVLARVRLGNGSGFKGNRVVASLGPPDVAVCSLQVPETLLNKPQEVLIRGIRQEVGRHVSLPIETAELAAWALADGHADGPNLLVAAAPGALIEQLLTWIRSQNCVCTRIDLAPLAILRACKRMMTNVDTDGLWGVLDLGSRSSRLYLGVGETPVYIRSLRGNGSLMTRRIANELGVAFDLAERYKKHYGIGSRANGYRPMLAQQGPVDDKRMAGILLGTLTPLVRGMAQDIEKSFRYGMDLYPSLSVSGLILTGGGSHLDGLTNLLTKLLGIEVHRVSAEGLRVANGDHPMLSESVLPGMVSCLGLCYGELEP